MKQLGLFEEAVSREKSRWKLFVDGASKSNPGPSGAGIYILKNDALFIKCGYYLGLKTNNQAEYLALILGLFIVSEHKSDNDSLHIISDSLLLVKQITGHYKVNHPQLKPLHHLAQSKVRAMKAVITHVLRAENGDADEMANQGVKYKSFPPQHYIQQLKHYDITLES